MTVAKSETVQGGSLAGLFAADGSPVPLLGVHFKGRLEGSALDLTVSHRFRNAEKAAIEAVYVFPLPEEGVVHGLVVRSGDRVIRAVAEEREKAFEIYDRALADGNGAFLLDQERPNIFHISVGAVSPGAEVVAETTVTLPVRVTGKELRLALPTTISPRYTPASMDAADRAEWERVTPPYARSVPYGVTLELEILAAEAIRAVDSPSHPLRVELDGSRAVIGLGAGVSAMDRDIVVRLELAAAPQAVAWASMRGERDHCRLEFAPVVEPPKDAPPRGVMFVVDCSGSMGGDSIREARRAVEICLRSLRVGDSFRILRFGSRMDDLTGGWRTFDQERLDDTAKKLRGMDADLGGTEILPALQDVFRDLALQAVDVVVLTDGQVSNEADVLEFVRRSRDRMRVFSFGIGAGSSEFLVRGLARESGGEAEFIFPGERIEPKVLRQFGRIQTPRVSDLSVDWAGRRVEAAPAAFPPLFSGDAWSLTARAKAGEAFRDGERVRVTGRTEAGPLEWEVAVRRVPEGGALPMLWVRDRLRDLEERFGAPSASRQKRPSDPSRSEAVGLAVEYGIASSLTSLVAVEERSDKEKTSGPLELRRVPSAITRGWHGMGAVEEGMCIDAEADLRRSFVQPPPVSGQAKRETVEMHTRTIAPAPCFPREQASASPVSFKRKLSSVANASAPLCEPFGLADAADGFFADRAVGRKFESKQRGEYDVGLDPWYLRLLTEQSADGSFSLTGLLAEGSGKKLAELKGWVKESGLSGKVAERLLATALALVLLAKLAAEHEGEWRPAAQKARAFLAGKDALPGGGTVAAWLESRLP